MRVTHAIVAPRGRLRTARELRVTFKYFQKLDDAEAMIRQATKKLAAVAFGGARRRNRMAAARHLGEGVVAAETRVPGFAKQFVALIETGPWLRDLDERRAFLSRVTNMERDALRSYISDTRRERKRKRRRSHQAKR